MRSARYSLFALVLLCVALMGCGGPQYIPKDLSSTPIDELGVFRVPDSAGKVRIIQIDGQKVRGKEFILAPGEHELECEVWGTTRGWYMSYLSMTMEGYKLQRDDSFVKGGVTARPQYRRYAWIEHSLEFSIEPGNTTELSVHRPQASSGDYKYLAPLVFMPPKVHTRISTEVTEPAQE